MLKSYVLSIGPVYEALAGAQSVLLVNIRDVVSRKHHLLQMLNFASYAPQLAMK